MSKTMAIIALVLSFLFFVPLAPLAGFIMGLIAYRKSKTDTTIPMGIALAAMIIGGIFSVIGLIMFSGCTIGFMRNMFGSSSGTFSTVP
ncbi:MAG: hypothetical protein KKF44_04340 [Nanoarchaeota archaeon]|nr:hypothetical protein [Nanoarchaeota archaeon]